VDVATHDVIGLLGIGAAVITLLVLEPRLHIPYPILLVLGGLAISLLPIVPDFQLPPDLVLLAFLPPLIFGAAFATPVQELRANVAPITAMAIGLVLATACAVAVVAHEVMELPWAAAFVLGAVVGPTDPVAATLVARRLGVPRRLVAIVEGESLVNDATSLVLYRFAVAAVVTGAFTLWKAGLTFLWTAAAGVAIGLFVAWCARRLGRRLDNPRAEIVITLMIPFVAYLPAEAAGASAVLAAVAAGVYLSLHAHEISTAHTRLGRDAVWDTLTFVLNAILFVLIGLQLPEIIRDTAGASLGELIEDAAAIFAVVVAARFAWVYSARLVRRTLGLPSLSARESLLVSWAGMRGAVSLAAALAIPLATDVGDRFPGRNLIVFTTFAVILGTLVLQGLSFPWVVRRTGLEDEVDDVRVEAGAALTAVDAALARLDRLEADGTVEPEIAERVRVFYALKRSNLGALTDVDQGEAARRMSDYAWVRRELIDAEREALDGLRRAGTIDEEMRRRVERDLDHQEVRWAQEL
jgi:CPA1 family monovalent cation:H+ antiporter